MSLICRYSTIDKAIIATTGNSLVVCGDVNEISVNTSDMITPSGETTRDYMKSGSDAQINILDNSIILYAELVWLSTVKSTMKNAIDVRSTQDNSITFITPKETILLTPEYTDSSISSIGSIDRLRATNVTNIIKNSLSGTYTVCNVPTSIPPSGLSEVTAGWSLTVIYRHNSFKPKRIVYCLGLEATTSRKPIQATFTGFKTDANQNYLKGEFVAVFSNGNPHDGIDTIKIGKSFAQLTVIGNPAISSTKDIVPNNPWHSFSSGQVNIADTLHPNKGLLDITGTKGDLNHNAFAPSKILGARNKWDITAVDISHTLTANQTQLAAQYSISNTTSTINLVSFGTQINSEAPDIVTTLSCYDTDGNAYYNILLDEHMFFVVQIKNTGKSVANNVILSTILNPALEFIPNLVTINGIPQIGSDITKGINVGSIEPTGITNLIFTIKAVSLVSNNNAAKTIVDYNYSFTSGAGSPPYINYGHTNAIDLIIQDGNLSVVKKTSSNEAKLGDTLIYTTEITNTGSENNINMIFQDKINKYCSFIPGTVKIDGIVYENHNPNNSFPLANLAPNDKSVITFSVKVNTLSPNTVVENEALVTFCYIFSNYIVPLTKTILSNKIRIQMQFTDIVTRRTSDNYYPNVNDTITYSLSLTNIGNIKALNAQVREPLIPGTIFVDGSVYIDDLVKLDYNPFTGFILDSINLQTTTKITYKVVVNQIQADQMIENMAIVPFKYQITPDGPVLSSEKDSNKVTTRSNFVTINISETVDRPYSTIGEILYYSVNMSNSGNVNTLNTTFLSTIQAESTFVPNTVAINGLIQLGYNPNLGFSIGTISPKNTVNVTFQAKVNSSPTPNMIYNTSQLVYSYRPNPNETPVTDTLISNRVDTIINNTNFSITKSVNKDFAMIGDYLVYKCILSNTGTVDLTNVSFNDELSSYIKFTPGTLSINGSIFIDYSPNKGFPIETIRPNDRIEVIFSAQVISAPPFGYLMNKGKVTYTYKLNPNTPIITECKRSNVVHTKVINGNLTLTKYTTLSYTTIDNIINYSFDISNTGNVTVTNISFFDQIPIGTTFIPGSVIVNGITKPDYNPIKGFNINPLNVGEVMKVNFNVKVTSVPTPNIINNNGFATYSYIINPNMPSTSKTSTSNNVPTVINKDLAILTTVVDKNYVTVNDIVTYTTTARNAGTVILTNVEFKDFLPSGATFLPNSVTIDNNSYTGYDPNVGFSIPNILLDGSVIVSFKATITSVPSPPKVDNQSSISYKYKINPKGQDYINSVSSNPVTTYINQVTITNTKHVDKLYSTVTDTLTYTSTIKNTGNISITNTNFTDIIDPQTTFVPSSVIINNIPYPKFNPTLGFTLNNIAPRETITIVFKVTVTTLPPRGIVNSQSILYYKYKINPSGAETLSNIESNQVTTAIVSGALTVIKNTNRNYSRLNDTVNYDFIITNTGNKLLSSLLFRDIIQKESTFNPGTVLVDGIAQKNYNPNNGFLLNDLPVGKYVTVSFTVTVNSLPSNGKLYNTGNVNYSYYIDPNQDPLIKNEISNTTTININDAIVSCTKSVDKDLSTIGSILNFSVIIYNSGNIPAKLVRFTDLLSSNIKFNSGSVIINGDNKSDYNPNNSFVIDDISPLSTTKVTFSATIISRPADNIIKNFAAINYKYNVSPSDPSIEVNLNTNTTTTYVAVAELTLNKSADKVYATVGNTITYTVNVKNTGSVNATKIIFKDLNPSNTTFVPHTVVVDSVPQETFDPNIGFLLSDLISNQNHTVSFNITSNSLPDSGKIDNVVSVSFDYKLMPTDQIKNKIAKSNIVSTTINLGKLTVTKTVNALYETIGKILNYTIQIENIGNMPCKNIFFRDIIQAEATFIPESVKVNDITKSSFNPNTGFNLDDIVKNAITIVSFNVVIDSLPSDYYMKNIATTNYEYIINPANEPIAATSISNTATTNIIVGDLRVTKETNKTYATIDDIVSYSVVVVNIGNTIAKFVNFRDIIQTGLTFVADSLTINGVNKLVVNPYEPFTLGDIYPGDSVVVKFDTKVSTVPSPSLITNVANIEFHYNINPTDTSIVKEVDSNPVTTQINFCKLNIIKSVDKKYSPIDGVLTYTIEVINTGNIDALNVIFKDGIQLEASFITGSVTVDGISKLDYNPQVGFILGKISTLDKSTITFKVKVNSLPLEYMIFNIATATFSYKINPIGETYTNSTQSKPAYTIIIVAGLRVTKSVNLPYATLGDILEYSISIKNTGNSINKSLFFIDTLSSGATFEVGTLIINDVIQPALNPTTGFDLLDLAPGNTTVITFNAKVTSLPVPSQVTNFVRVNGIYNIDLEGPDYQIGATSNTVTTQINVGNLVNIQSIDKMYAKVGDTLTYTNTLTNLGNITAINAWFFDNIHVAGKFITGTVRINNIIYPSLNPTTGFTLGDIACNQVVIVSFDVKIISLPVPAQIINKSQSQFSYKIVSDGNLITKTNFSNNVLTNIVIGNLTATKIVDKVIATIEDILIYTINLSNLGNVTATDIWFQDPISSGSIFVPESIIVNGISKSSFDPTKGFALDNISIGNITTVQFKVKIISLPATNKVTNQAVINFKFMVDPKQPAFSTTTYSNITTTNIAFGNLNVNKSVDKQFITIGQKLTYTIVISNTGNIDASDVVFVDPTPKNSVFVSGSVTVNKASNPLANPSVGFKLDTMKPGEIITVVYQVEVI